MRSLFLGAPPIGGTRRRSGTSLLRKLMPRARERVTLMPVAEQPAELAEAFGMVIRDPFYEWDRHELHPQTTNYEFLTEMASNLYALGVRWVRIEFHADPGGSYGAIDYRKYDWFINVLAPRFGLKILALFTTDIVSGNGSEIGTFQVTGAADPQNAYIKVFADRAVEIATRYGRNLHAYEILNALNNDAAPTAEQQSAQDEISPEAVGTLMCAVFPRLKAVQDVPVLLGGLRTGLNKDLKRNARRYLSAIYESSSVRAFRSAESRWPFDALGLHPYHDAAQNVDDVEEVLGNLSTVHALMKAHGDPGRIWITQIGMESGPPPKGDRPSEGEIRQANFLNGVYTGVLRTKRDFVERIFWFRYEDSRVARDETWGVVRLEMPLGTKEPNPDGVIARRRPAFDVYSALTPAPAPLAAIGPAAPTNFEVVKRLGGDVEFAWQAGVPGTYPIKEHQLYRASEPDMSDAEHVTSLEYTLRAKGRAPRGASYYAICAVDTAVPPNISDFSNVVKVTRRI